MISLQNRNESNRHTERQARYQQILAAWEGEMTAREVARKLGFEEMNAVRPRITELVGRGVLEEAGSRYDGLTKRSVTCWRKVTTS